MIVTRETVYGTFRIDCGDCESPDLYADAFTKGYFKCMEEFRKRITYDNMDCIGIDGSITSE